MNSEVPDEQIAQCFGKNRSCSRNCRMKEICLGKYRENKEEENRKKYRKANYVDGMDAGAGHVAPGFDATTDDETGKETAAAEVLAAIEQLDISDRCRRDLLRIFRTHEDGESARESALELLRKLGEVYCCDPVGFEVMFFQILAGGNQAALARRRGCSKQNINKIVAHGKKRLAAYRQMAEQHPECRLTVRELAVFHAVEIEGMTYRKAADILGCSRETIRRMCQKLRLKGVKCAKKRPGRRKATKKATSTRSGRALNPDNPCSNGGVHPSKR